MTIYQSAISVKTQPDRQNPAMARQIALLRGVNVGGNKKVEMAKLRAVVEELGHTDVRTYVNSGNVVFTGPKRAALLPPLTRRSGTPIRARSELSNPARPYAQVVGVADERMLPLMAEVLARRGTRALLFRGVDGLDELTTTDLSTVYDVKDGTVRETHLDPAKLGLAKVKPDELAGGDAPYNAEITRRIIDGETGACRDVVILNAGAALRVAGFAESLEEGMATAGRAIDDGEAAKTLTRWVEVSNAG